MAAAMGSQTRHFREKVQARIRLKKPGDALCSSERSSSLRLKARSVIRPLVTLLFALHRHPAAIDDDGLPGDEGAGA
jgi:hypothetical protein